MTKLDWDRPKRRPMSRPTSDGFNRAVEEMRAEHYELSKKLGEPERETPPDPFDLIKEVRAMRRRVA